MKKLSDEKLLEELKRRIEERKQTYAELEKLNNELHKANQKLMESEKLKSNFLSNARNEVINPLSSILNLAHSMASGESKSLEESREFATIIYKEAFDLDFQMNNIFISAEIEAGEAICEFYNMNLLDLAHKTVEKFKNLASEKNKNLVIENNLSDTFENIKSDPGKNQIILDNLIVNALQWAKNDGDVIINLSGSGEFATIKVSDPGPGMDPEEQNLIFDRFRSLNMTVNTENKGHGLGLSIVKSFVEMMDGSISVESKKSGGSTFIIKIKNQPEGDVMPGSSSDGRDFMFDNGAELF